MSLQIRANDGVRMVYGEGRQREKVRGDEGLEKNGQRKGRGGHEGHEVQK